jgi:hypothetical protein
MRTLSTFFMALGVSLSLQGQGEIGFNNIGASPEQKVYIDEWLNPSSLAPGGRQFLVALYFARIEDGESSLVQIGDATGFIGSPDRTGVFWGGGRTVPTTLPGQMGLFQVKGWEAAYGTTYEQAAANPAARIGQSPVFLADTEDPVIQIPAPDLIQPGSPRPFRGFVIAVPEPSTPVLALVGVVTIALVLRSPKGVTSRSN